MGNLFYDLDDDRNPVECETFPGGKFNTPEWRVGWDEVGRIQISTVFLGIDHNRVGAGPPVLFETMIFGGKYNCEQRRYCTWDEAERGHAGMLALVKESERTRHTGLRRLVKRLTSWSGK